MSKKTIIPYDHHLVEKAKILRKKATYSEKLLWRHLRDKQINSFGFDRQKPIDKYIVDFFCSELKLVIEIDGITHNNSEIYNFKRQKKLEELGLTVLRFNALDVVTNIQGVLEMIQDWIMANKPPFPSPSEQGN